MKEPKNFETKFCYQYLLTEVISLSNRVDFSILKFVHILVNVYRLTVIPGIVNMCSIINYISDV